MSSDSGNISYSVILNSSSVIEMRQCEINSKSFDYILISRRCVYRAGTRFNMRGVDSEGKVANFVETEQIVVNHAAGQITSFVQVSLKI